MDHGTRLISCPVGEIVRFTCACSCEGRMTSRRPHNTETSLPEKLYGPLGALSPNGCSPPAGGFLIGIDSITCESTVPLPRVVQKSSSEICDGDTGNDQAATPLIVSPGRNVVCSSAILMLIMLPPRQPPDFEAEAPARQQTQNPHPRPASF